MANSAGAFWTRPVTTTGIVALPLAVVAVSLTTAPGHPSAGWRLLVGGMWLACGWVLGWGARARRARIEAAHGLRPRRPDEPEPPDDRPPGGAPVA